MKTLERPYFISLLIRFLLILLCYISNLYSRAVNTDVVILGCIVLYISLVLYFNLAYVIKYAALIAPAFLALLGTYIIEHNTMWLWELQKQSHYSGSFPLFTGYYLSFLFTLELFDCHYISRLRINKPEVVINVNKRSAIDDFLFVFGIAFFLLTSFMVLRLIRHPYFVVHMDRFNYQSVYIQGVWKKAADYYYYFIPLVLMNMHRKKLKVLSIVTLGEYVLYQFIQGEKYGGYITLLLFCVLYFIPMMKQSNRKKMKGLFNKVVFVFMVALCTILLQYSLLSSTSPIQHLFERFAQQGQLWWSVYDLQKDSIPHLDEVTDELQAYQDDGTNERPYYAIYKMMYLSAPEKVVTNKIASGATYTESSAASIYYYFGAWGLPFFAFLTGWFFAFMSYKYVDYIRRKCVIEAMIVTRLILLGRSFHVMSRFTWLFDRETLITILILLISVTMRHRFHGIITKAKSIQAKVVVNKYNRGSVV